MRTESMKRELAYAENSRAVGRPSLNPLPCFLVPSPEIELPEELYEVYLVTEAIWVGFRPTPLVDVHLGVGTIGLLIALLRSRLRAQFC